MDPISLILLTVQSLGVVLHNPALGGGSSVKFDQASQILGILATFIMAGKAGEAHLRRLAEVVQKMKDESRGPSREEWASLVARRDAAHEALQALKPQLEAEAAAEKAASKKKGKVEE